MMRGRFGYDRIFLYGVRGGARTAELVNSLCDFDFERVAIDALPVPLDSSLAERFLELEISEVGLLQTVGPFWGLHAWIDFPLSARSPTVYFPTEQDFQAARRWLRYTKRTLAKLGPEVLVARKDIQFGGAEFTKLESFLSGEIINDAIPLLELGD